MEEKKVIATKPRLSAEDLSTIHELICQRMQAIGDSQLFLAEERKIALFRFQKLAERVNVILAGTKL